MATATGAAVPFPTVVAYRFARAKEGLWTLGIATVALAPLFARLAGSCSAVVGGFGAVCCVVAGVACRAVTAKACRTVELARALLIGTATHPFGPLQAGFVAPILDLDTVVGVVAVVSGRTVLADILRTDIRVTVAVLRTGIVAGATSALPTAVCGCLTLVVQVIVAMQRED